jgi:hypothetical protein
MDRDFELTERTEEVVSDLLAMGLTGDSLPSFDQQRGQK